jgi:lysophospholipase L1-like esterase
VAECVAPLDATGDDRQRVFMIGDSSLSRWPPGALDQHWNFVNCGRGGETSVQLARRFPNFDFIGENDVVLISAGINDLTAATFLDAATAKTVVEQTSGRLIALAQNASARSRHVLLATIIPPSRPSLARLPVWRESIREFVAQANAKIRLAARNEKLEIVDFSAALGSDDRRTPNVFRDDTLHLNDLGYHRLAEVLSRALPAPR